MDAAFSAGRAGHTERRHTTSSILPGDPDECTHEDVRATHCHLKMTDRVGLRSALAREAKPQAGPSPARFRTAPCSAMKSASGHGRNWRPLTRRT
jgi:hypothetical protein